jgi:hypothetical protein
MSPNEWSEELGGGGAGTPATGREEDVGPVLPPLRHEGFPERSQSDREDGVRLVECRRLTLKPQQKK